MRRPGPAAVRFGAAACNELAEDADVTASLSQVQKKAREFVALATAEERMLLVLKRELYEGSWDEMETDLRARLEGRPYIFKLVHRISEDLERIARLRQYERLHSVDLSDFVSLNSER